MKIPSAIRHESTKTLVREIESFVEVAFLSIIYYLVWDFFYNNVPIPLYQGKGKFVLMGIYAVLAYALFRNMDGFRFGDLGRFDLGLAQWLGIFMTNIITYFQLSLIHNVLISPLPLLGLTAFEVVATTIFIYLYAFIYHKLYAPHRMIMVYGTDSAVALKLKMDRRRDKYRIKKLISADEGFEKICEEIDKYDAVVLNDISPQLRNDLVKFCYKNEHRVYLAPKITDVIMRGSKNISLFDTPIFLIKGTGLSITQRAVKRFIDLVLCLIAMVPALPILLIVALAIKIEDGGPVFYKQKRATIGAKEFEILKFRSMIVNAEASGISIPATGDDPRITKVGKVIRATRVDELPQILNIIKGDMSIVGPRPERIEHVKEYTEQIPEFAFRLKVKGGLTGYAQIYGKYNTGAYDKLRMDLMYIENYSLLLDIKLILTTIRIMFSKDSTEGFEKQEENEKLLQQFIEQSKKQ